MVKEPSVVIGDWSSFDSEVRMNGEKETDIKVCIGAVGSHTNGEISNHHPGSLVESWVDK